MIDFNYLTIAYIINFVLLAIASYTDIKKREIPHIIVILMLLINLPIGYYLFGIESIWAFFATLILCLILGIGMGGGDIKVFTVLAPLFVGGGSIFHIPKSILLLIGISAGLAALYPMTNILKRYWKDIIPSSTGLAVVFGFLIYLLNHYHVPYATLFLWAYIIISIVISRKIPKYKDIIKKSGYLAPIYLIGLYLVDSNYFINNNILLSFFIYLGELTLISIVIYALTGAEISSKKPISELKEGDILRDMVYLKDNNVKVESANILKRFKQMVNAELGKNNEYDKIIMTDGEGLYKEDVGLLQNLHKEGKLPDELNIITTYPFVPFVLVGYVVILIIHYYFNIF
ncbi:A24 family peptidase C-terminal domain-containing protein [Methanothermococcus okinawensis]|uniref:Peptidase A24A domain protein n=1 Tax=Methanothermococcus okinawensis (strain DSM 14208 / JCM 11175 / IH1) TaxID=647113 RepID=F8AKD2_METOI|nr:A24 family peptidase C-terminal domain-containing protein [Methanothermococcus okinawensis]AEH06332.1 Peptidase A24A domain protein [Methanothermococcus okinawensis IH1]